jgi:hypothetical protein
MRCSIFWACQGSEDFGDLSLRFPTFTSFGGSAAGVMEVLELGGPDKIESHMIAWVYLSTSIVF